MCELQEDSEETSSEDETKAAKDKAPDTQDEDNLTCTKSEEEYNNDPDRDIQDSTPCTKCGLQNTFSATTTPSAAKAQEPAVTWPCAPYVSGECHTRAGNAEE